MIDQHFSSAAIADQLASFAQVDRPLTVFDPAMGDGSLLAAIERRTPLSEIVGADIDPGVVARVHAAHPDWRVSVADALLPRSRAASHAWRRAMDGDVDYVLLNPPFSFRGYGGVDVDYAGVAARATPAAAFVALCLGYVRPTRGLVAVLPAGSLRGERDRALWRRIASDWRVEVVGDLPRGSFAGVAASSQIVCFRPGETLRPACDSGMPVRDSEVCGCVDVIRGRVPVARHQTHSDDELGELWIHTTSVRQHEVQALGTGLPAAVATTGPFVTMPRVGRFDAGKIAVFQGQRAVLSDCVYALRPLGLPLEIFLDDIIARSDELAAQFLGTGAPHMTLGRLADFLVRLGYDPRFVPASATAEPCSCRQNAASPLPPRSRRGRLVDRSGSS